MAIRWIIIGFIAFNVPQLNAQISLQIDSRRDSLLSAMKTTTSNYQLAQIADELLGIVDTTQSTKQLYEIYRTRGLSQSRSGNYAAALGSQQAANRIAHALKDSFLIAQSTYSIGSILYNQEQPDFARQHFQEAAKIFIELDSLRWLAYVYNAYGLLERANENWEKAIGYYHQSYRLLDSTGYREMASIPLNNIGDIYLKQKKYAEALDTFRKTLMLVTQLNHPREMAIAYLNIGQALRELRQKDQAILNLHRGLTLARKEGFRRIETLGLKDLADTYKFFNNSDSAYVYLEDYLDLQDSLQNEASEARFEELYLAYESQKDQIEMSNQKQEINALKQDKKLNQLSNYFIISLLMLALMLISFFFIRNRMKRKLAEIELRNQKLEAKQIRRELDGKQKDLTNLALEIARKNELFTKTNQTLLDIDLNSLPSDQRQKIEQLIQFNNNQLRINEDLEELLTNIEQVNTGFFEKLLKVAPDLTPYEKQLCAMFRLNLSNKEIAAIRNISPKSVEMARYRLRKKLPIEAEDDIYTFIQNI